MERLFYQELAAGRTGTVDKVMLRQQRKVYAAVVAIDHPPANTWNLASMKAFEQVIQAVEEDRQAQVVIIAGAGGKYFSGETAVKCANCAMRLLGAYGYSAEYPLARFYRDIPTCTMVEEGSANICRSIIAMDHLCYREP